MYCVKKKKSWGRCVCISLRVVFLTRRRRSPDVPHSSQPSPFVLAVFFPACGQTNNWEPLFSHTQPLESLGAPPLTSQGRCLCTVLLCHGRLVPLGSALANPSLSFLGAGPVFSQGSLFISPCPPLPPHNSVQPRPNPSPFQPVTVTLHAHTKYHGPQVWKPQDKKRPPASFWGMLQDVQVSEGIKEEEEKNATTK